MSISFASIEPAKDSTCKISDLRVGDAFIRGYHTIDAILNNSEPYSLYVKLPRSPRSLGDVEAIHAASYPTARSQVPELQRVSDALRENRIAYNLTKCSCAIIDADERLIRVNLEVDVKVVI